MNIVGARTLLRKEIRRFLRVPGQTVLSPLITTTLYFVVFGYALGGNSRIIGSGEAGVPYVTFIVPGLVFMGLANNAFLNSSSSLFIAKLQGTVVDLLVAPLGPRELLFGFIGGGIVRGLAVALLTWLVAALFTGFHVAHPLVAIFFLVATAYVFSVLGMLAALWSEKFEQVNFFPTFVMLPLTFLGGVFYPIDTLAEPFHTISLFNPMVYMVDGVRYGFLGTSTLSPWAGAALLLTLAALSTGLAHVLLATGYKLKA